MAKLKITVLERTFNEEIAEEYGSDGFKAGSGFGPCPNFTVGQTFILDGLGKPDRFCSWAWADIHREVRTVAFGGGYGWVDTPHSAITCCTDGMK
ncbi:TIGR04076 family protein, partial [Candidatus Bipolaricaulota bacterium]